jgi:hypothetical protein
MNLAESKELEDFVRSACVAIQKGVTEGLEIKYPIEFEVAVVIKKGTDGIFNLVVVNESNSQYKEEISRINFKIGKKEASGGRIRFFRE